MPTDAEKCELEIFEGGRVAIILRSGKMETELFVEFLREFTGQRVDWSYFAGRPVVRVHPDDDFDKVAQVALNTGIAATPAYGTEYYEYLYEKGYLETEEFRNNHLLWWKPKKPNLWQWIKLWYRLW